MRIKFEFKIIESGVVYADEANVESIETAKEEIEQLLKEFNEEEKRRYGDTVRYRILESIDLGTKEKEQ